MPGKKTGPKMTIINGIEYPRLGEIATPIPGYPNQDLARSLRGCFRSLSLSPVPIPGYLNQDLARSFRGCF